MLFSLFSNPDTLYFMLFEMYEYVTHLWNTYCLNQKQDYCKFIFFRENFIFANNVKRHTLAT